MSMKENQNANHYESKSFGRESDPMAFESKEIYELNDSRIDTIPVAFEAKGRDECWKHKLVDDFPMHTENGTIDSSRKEDQKGLIRPLTAWKKDTYSLSSDTHDEDKDQRSLDHESSVTAENFTHCNGNESRDTSSSCTSASDLSHKDTILFSAKNELECELPEEEVCYKEINYHIVKDICIDEGRSEKEKDLIENCQDDKPGQPPDDNNHCKVTEVPPQENAKDLSADQCGSKEENNGEIVSQGRLKPTLESLFDKDDAKHCDPEDSLKTGEAKSGANGKAMPDSSEEDSLVDTKLPMQEFGTRSFLRSFLNSLDEDGNKVTQPPDQVHDGKTVSEGAAASPAEAGGPEQASSLLYNSKVESGSITFNFNSPSNETTENIKDQSVHPAVVQDNQNTNAGNHSDAGQVHFTRSSIGSIDEQSLTIKDGNSDRSSGNVSVDSQLQHDAGETSFSAAGLISYSGPIVRSGSLSHRSDGSGTSAASGRSFAFPILQSEWNSSPVRMAKADRKHFRKHKGWRSGLLCCRF